MIGDYIRVALTLALIALVYMETGWATALCIFLIAARVEIQDINEGRTFRSIDSKAEQ